MKEYDFPVYNVGSGNLARFDSNGKLVYVEINPDIAGLPWSPEVGQSVPPGDFHPANQFAEDEMKEKSPPAPSVEQPPSLAPRFSDFFWGMANYPWRQFYGV